MTSAPARKDDDSPQPFTAWLGVAAIAIAGLALGLTPVAERLDLLALDASFGIIRAAGAKPAPDDIVIVGLDEATTRAVKEPLGIWHEPLGALLKKIASARPRAIGLDLVIADRSYESIRPGLDLALLEGLVAARDAAPFVLGLGIDARGEARPIHPPFVAVVGVQRLGLVVLGRDPDGVTRRFAPALPTEDGSFPTFFGRLCATLAKDCRAGLVDYALGPMYRYVPMQRVLEMTDEKGLARLFAGRIVLVGETQRFTDRIAQPVNLAGWEQGRSDAPGVLAHAQALRTAMHGHMIATAGPAFVMLLTAIAALLFLVRDWRLAFVGALLVSIAFATTSVVALRAGWYLPVMAAILTALLAATARAGFDAWRHRRERDRLRLGFAGYVSPPVLEAILAGRIEPGHRPAKRFLAFVFADLRGSTALTAGVAPEEAMALLNRFHEVMVAATHRHEGFLDNIRGDGVMAVFGAPKPIVDPARAAWSAVADMARGLERLNAQLAKEGHAPLAIAIGAASGEGVVGHVGGRERFNYTAIGNAANLAARLESECKRLEFTAVVTQDIARAAGGESLESVGTLELKGLEPVEAWGWRRPAAAPS